MAADVTNDRINDLCLLGLSTEQAQVIAREINENGCVLTQMKVHQLIRELITSLHTGTWFEHEGCDGALHVRKGTRQGCRFGGCFLTLRTHLL